MQKTGSFVILCMAICWGGAAFASTCEPGYYPLDGNCTICPMFSACPDGDTIISCSERNPAQYTDGPGATKCLDCPTTVIQQEGFIQIYHSRYDGYGLRGCRAQWQRHNQHGHITFSCLWADGGYEGSINDSLNPRRCMVDMDTCNAGYVSMYPQNELRFWVNSYELAIQEACIPAGIGSYSADGDLNATACPTGTSTRTATAASVDECLPLCTGGATKLHAGAYAFNLWRDKYTTPAMNIQLSGGNICYANIESGKGNLNINFNNTTYHVTN